MNCTCVFRQIALGTLHPIAQVGELCEFCSTMLADAKVDAAMKAVTTMEERLLKSFEVQMEDFVLQRDLEDEIDEAIQKRELMDETEVDDRIEKAFDDVEFVEKRDLNDYVGKDELASEVESAFEDALHDGQVVKQVVSAAMEHRDTTQRQIAELTDEVTRLRHMVEGMTLAQRLKWLIGKVVA